MWPFRKSGKPQPPSLEASLNQFAGPSSVAESTEAAGKIATGYTIIQVKDTDETHLRQRIESIVEQLACDGITVGDVAVSWLYAK